MSIHPDSYAAHIDKEHIRNCKEPPEMHIHAAVTFVVPGDPMGKTQEERRDKAWEAGQYVVKVEPHHVANLKRQHIDAAMLALKHEIMNVIRRCGGLKAGE